VLNRLLVSSDTVGGVWRYTLEIASGFAARGTQVILVTLGPPPNTTQVAEVANLPGVRLLPTDLPLDWLATDAVELAQAAHALAGLAAEIGADAIHLHTPALVGDAAWPAPVVAVAHSCVGTWWQAMHGSALPPDLAWRAAAIAQGMRMATGVIAPSRSFAAALSAFYQLDRPISVVHNGRRQTPSTAKRTARIFTAGRLWDAGKNAVGLDQVAARVPEPIFAAGPTTGPHGERVALPHLHLLGTLDAAQMANHYAMASIFVSLARYEPFGLSVLEAAQAGCALVLAETASFRELWDCAAVFVNPADPDHTARTLRNLSASPRRCAHLGDLARRRASTLGSERMVAATWQIHQQLQSARLRSAA
jgi:glycosyltransferase involved in cell wall biosynthesis